MATALLNEGEGLRFRSSCGRLMPTLCSSFRRQHSLMATALLDDCEGRGLRSPCSSLMPTSFVGRLRPLIQYCQRLRLPSRDRRQHFLVAMVHLDDGPVSLFYGEGLLAVLSLIKMALFHGKSVIAVLYLGECRTPLAGVLVTHASESGLAVLAP